MALKRKEVFLREEYGYFTKTEDKTPRVYAGIYNENKTSVYLISANEYVNVVFLNDLLKNSQLKRDIKITANLNKYGKGIPEPKSFIGSKFDRFYYSTDTVTYKGINLCKIISYYNNNAFLDSVYGQNKYPSFSCSVRMLLENEKIINKQLEKIIEKETALNNAEKIEELFEKNEK